MLNVHQLLVALRVMSVVSMYGKENDELPLLAMLEQDTLAPVVVNPPLPLDANSVLLLQDTDGGSHSRWDVHVNTVVAIVLQVISSESAYFNNVNTGIETHNIAVRFSTMQGIPTHHTCQRRQQ